jgi:hypothetical protein
VLITTLIMAALAATYIASAVSVVFLTFRDVVDWFAARRDRVSRPDLRRIGFTLKDALANGRYQVVQGVFNTAQNMVEDDVRKIIAKSVDGQFAARHGAQQLVVYP